MVVSAALERRPEDRPAPDEIAEALQPVLERQPRTRLAGFRVSR
jgi:serine/threonine-protein kinase